MAAVLLLFGLLLPDAIAPRVAPVYSAASIVNAADNQVEPLAPNTIATLYGTNLAYATASLNSSEVSGGVLPTVLPGTGVRIIVGGIVANLYYVSPTQINFLVPANLIPGNVNVQLAIDGLAGPSASVTIAAASPALFQLDPVNAVATLADGTVITPSTPATAGDIVILYATGLGQTTPPLYYSELPTSAAWLQQAAEFRVVFDGADVPAGSILYAGIAPGFAGLYQINVIVPASTGPNPQIQIGIGNTLSTPGVRLPLQP